MKKVIAPILTLAMIAALCTCGHEHAWSDWKTTKEASCTEDGMKERSSAYRVLADDIVPLASGKVYVYFSVAPAVQEGTEPLTATFSLFGHSFTVDCRAA